LAAGIVCIIIHAGLLYTYTIVVVRVTAFIAVAALLVIMPWIGWTIAITPPVAPLELWPALHGDRNYRKSEILNQ
jgi:hypothetical protein